MSEREETPQSTPQEPQPFILAARFRGESAAGRVYFRVQDAVYKAPESELSVYRFQLERIYHVAVLGETPPEPFDSQLRRLLATGEFTALPDDVLTMLFQRRAEAGRQGSWVEGHYRPGKHL